MLDGPHVYDKAEYHLDMQKITREQACIHTGMFLAWLIDHNLLSVTFAQRHESEISDYRARKLTGPQLYRRSGSVLVASMLNDEGNAFTHHYYYQYCLDYEDALAGNGLGFYDVADTWANYDKMRRVVDGAYDSWKTEHATELKIEAQVRDQKTASKKWWSLW